MPSPDSVVITYPGQSWPIALERAGNKLVVRYGAESQRCDTYEAAARALGYALMHALACDSHVPERMMAEADGE